MARLVDTSDTGLQTFVDYDDASDRMVVSYKQDLRGFLDVLRERRNANDSAAGIKESWWHYATIPEVVILELRAKGIDVFNQDHAKRVFQEINANYPYLKLSTKTHA